MNPSPPCVSFIAAISAGYHTKSPLHLDFPARQRPEPTLPPDSPGLPGRTAPAPSRRSTRTRRKTRAGVGRGDGAGRGAQARWAPGWAEEATCSTPDAITLPETRRVSRITAETLPCLLQPLRPSPITCFLGSSPWGLREESGSHLPAS